MHLNITKAKPAVYTEHERTSHICTIPSFFPPGVISYLLFAPFSLLLVYTRTYVRTCMCVRMYTVQYEYDDTFSPYVSERFSPKNFTKREREEIERQATKPDVLGRGKRSFPNTGRTIKADILMLPFSNCVLALLIVIIITRQYQKLL